MAIESNLSQNNLLHTEKSVERAESVMTRICNTPLLISQSWIEEGFLANVKTYTSRNLTPEEKVNLLNRAKFSLWLELRDAGAQGRADKALSLERPLYYLGPSLPAEAREPVVTPIPPAFAYWRDLPIPN
jgi:hypothetical protein